MSNRHRLPYAALGGFLAVILGASLALAQEKKPPVLKDQPVSQGQKTPDEKGAEAESQKNTPPPEQLTPALRQIETAIRELVNQQRAAQEKGPAQHEIKDLEAQRDMALWAKFMFFATIVAVGLTGFGIWLIKRTLDETKVAAQHTEGMLKEAVKTTQAATTANEISAKAVENSERMGQIQVRAYLIISKVRVRLDDQKCPVLDVVGRNSGQTPAGDVTLNFDCRISFDLKQDEYLIPNSIKFLEDIGANSDWPFTTKIEHPIPQDIVERCRKKKPVFIVVIKTKCRDVFGDLMGGESRFWATCSSLHNHEWIDLVAYPHTWQQNHGNP